MRFTKIPTGTFNELQLNAGVLLTGFDPTQATIPYNHVMIGATSGGVQFTATPSFVDMGEDVDNAPKNTKELKKLDTWDIKMSGTFVTLNEHIVHMTAGAGDVGLGEGFEGFKFVPRNDLQDKDFNEIWWVGDYGSKGGFIAIHMMNTLSTGGFQLQSTDKEKGQFAFEFTAHYSSANIDQVPFEVYICDEITER